MVAMALIATSATSAFAATVDQTTQGEAQTNITFEYKNDPTYSVTIPSELSLTNTGAKMDIVAENVENLNGQKVSVTIEGTDKYRNQMLLEGKTAEGKNASLRYQLIKEDETVIETTGGKNQVVGVELASFTDDGTATLNAVPVLSGSSSIKKGVTYTGSITYGIQLTAAE